MNGVEDNVMNGVEESLTEILIVMKVYEFYFYD